MTNTLAAVQPAPTAVDDVRAVAERIHLHCRTMAQEEAALKVAAAELVATLEAFSPAAADDFAHNGITVNAAARDLHAHLVDDEGDVEREIAYNLRVAKEFRALLEFAATPLDDLVILRPQLGDEGGSRRV